MPEGWGHLGDRRRSKWSSFVGVVPGRTIQLFAWACCMRTDVLAVCCLVGIAEQFAGACKGEKEMGRVRRKSFVEQNTRDS